MRETMVLVVVILFGIGVGIERETWVGSFILLWAGYWCGRRRPRSEDLRHARWSGEREGYSRGKNRNPDVHVHVRK